MPNRMTQTAQRINLYVAAYQSALEQISALQRREKPDFSLHIQAPIRRQMKAGETDAQRIAFAAAKDVFPDSQ